jgi:hypothetical protein
MEKIQSLPNTKSYDMFFHMKGHWDAILIGAGIGGLTATAVLEVLHRQKKYRFPG